MDESDKKEAWCGQAREFILVVKTTFFAKG
jgi:hypothetical protein